MNDANLAKASKMQLKKGIYAHACLPSGVDAPMLCVWECREPTSASEMQAFLDGPARPAGDAITTRLFPVLGGLAPPSAWPSDDASGATSAQSTGSFFWVEHSFVDAAAAASFLDGTPPATLASPMPELLHHHYCLQTGTAATDPVFSVWESFEPLSLDEFEGFICGSSSPFKKACSSVKACSTVVHSLMPCTFAAPPPAAFPHQTAFAGAMAMPLMDDTMNFMHTMMPFRLTREEELEAAPAAVEAAAKVDADEAAIMDLYGIWSKTPAGAEEVAKEVADAASAVHMDMQQYGVWLRDEELVKKVERATPLAVPHPLRDLNEEMDTALAVAPLEATEGEQAVDDDEWGL